MSFAVETVAPVTVTSVPQPEAGSTVTTGTVAITDPNTASTPITVGGTATAAIGTQNAQVILTGTPRITTGLDANGAPLAIGGTVIDGRNASSVVIDLAGGFGGGPTVPKSSLPSVVTTLGAGNFITASKLSDGDDQFLGSQYGDFVELSPGDDVVIGGGGDDVILMADSIKGSKKKLTLDGSGGNAGAGGSDDVILTRGALKKGKARIKISDFNAKEDDIVLKTNRKNVKGIGTDTLKISTKDNKTITIVSEGTRFKRSGIEFI
jgi:hypothetical protein